MVRTRVEPAARGTHPRRRLGRPCRACGSADTWVELRREVDRTRPAAAGEWPYAVCQSCGHTVRGSRTDANQTSTASHANPGPAGVDRVPAPRARRARPSRPKASDERVDELLRAAGFNRPITAEVLEVHRRFVTHAGKPGLPRWKAAVSVLNAAMGGDKVPDVREIYAEEKRRREVARSRAAQRRAQANALADEHVLAARDHVAQVWEQTGEGPTWRELAAALGVDGQMASPMIDVLHRRGALTSTKEARSLAVVPDWVPPSTPRLSSDPAGTENGRDAPSAGRGSRTVLGDSPG
jgi:hypothetical protein